MVRGRAHAVEVVEQVVAAVAGGVSVKAAARAAGVPASSAYGWWRRSSGLALVRGPRGGPLVRARPPVDPSGRYLSGAERAVIQAGLAQGLTLTAIASSIGRAASTVSREVRLRRGPDGVYRAVVAHAAAVQGRARPKPFKLACPVLCARIEGWMDQGWSPGLIAKVLAVDALTDPGVVRVSHETIYRALYVQARGTLRADLARRLSTGRTARKPRTGGAVVGSAATFAGALQISQRPATVADRAVPGHWEGDLIIGSRNGSAIGTLVERQTRFVLLLHLPDGHGAEAVATAMLNQMQTLPAHLRRSITWDRGSEMARYDRVQLALQAPVYFADPHSPWQRGSNENTNRLLRFWFTKGSDLSTWTADQIRLVQDTLNQRPRPTLGLRTPAQAFHELIAPTI